MTVFLNGQFLDESAARVPVTDRGFLFGDGIFETLRAARGKPLFWAEHLARWQRGAALLGIGSPLRPDALESTVDTLLKQNQLLDAVIRLTLTRGSGPRGYSPKGAGHQPTLLISVTAAPEPFGGPRSGWDLITSRQVIPPRSDLSLIKHTNRLPWILARAEAEAAGADEALLLTSSGSMAEASGSNLAWFEGDTLCVPATETGALPGVMQAIVRQQARDWGWTGSEAVCPPDQWFRVEGAFLTNSVQLVVPVRSLDGKPLRSSSKTLQIIDTLRLRWFAEGGSGG